MQNPLLSFTSFPISGGVLVPVEGSVVYDGARGNRDKILPSPFPKGNKASVLGLLLTGEDICIVYNL